MRKLVKRMASVLVWKSSKEWRMFNHVYPIRVTLNSQTRELNLHAMRTGPGKHLKGMTLMGGVVKPEEVNIFSVLQGQLIDLNLPSV